MAKLLLFSTVIIVIAVPLLTARDRDALRAFRKALIFFFAFNVVYLLAVRYVYPHLLN
jgi:hypothetical protein